MINWCLYLVLGRLILAKKNEVFFGTDEIVRRVGSIVPETWKRYHFRAETPCIGHYRKYVLRGVTSRYLQSGDQQLEPISTDSTCISWVSHLYMNMFKMLELWCPWKAPVKNTRTYMVSSIARALFYWFTIPVFALVCRLLSLLYVHPVCGQLHCSMIFVFLVLCLYNRSGWNQWRGESLFFWKATLT